MKTSVLTIIVLLLSLLPHTTKANAVLDSIESRLLHAPVQEKVYLHLDNNCYFMGDTIWYKAYVTRADDLRYSDMSRLVYVELVTPEGIVVERQRLIASELGLGNGQFVLRDSLYAGYYELRAYTRWMLNFCVTQHPHRMHDRQRFYNRELADDFFREYGTLHSRVVPVYDRPDMEGEYDLRFMTPRKKMREPEPRKEALKVTFYPEGGQLVAGTRCRVAFEAVDQLGQAQDVSGQVRIGKDAPLQIQTSYMGRGEFEIDVPANGTPTATFGWKGKEYRFDLPKSDAIGCALRLTQTDGIVSAQMDLRGCLPNDTLAAVVTCRGRLMEFRRFAAADGHVRLRFAADSLQTGVCDLVVLDAQGRAMADRLFFVDRHDYSPSAISLAASTGLLTPLAAHTFTFEAPADARHLSIAIRDSQTDEATYDTGTLLTDLLLSSELQGFVADPQHYFAPNNPTATRDLDLLMMVQGWRRYDYAALASAQPLRYQPEVCLTVEGDVFDTVDMPGSETEYQMAQSMQELVAAGVLDDTLATSLQHNANYGGEHPRLKHEVVVESELVLTDEVGDVEVETSDRGHFAFNVPAYYGQAFLFLSAHKLNASQRHQQKMRTKDRLNEAAIPDFYVKQHLAYPVFAKPYDYYQCHMPEVRGGDDEYYWWMLPGQEMVRISSMDTRLENVEVRAQRHRGSRVVDLDQPLCTFDAVDLYNLVTDYGLSYGRFNYNRFAQDVVAVLFGSYDNSGQEARVQTRMGDDLSQDMFNPNDPLEIESEKMTHFTRTYNMQLKRIDSVQVFTDFNLRQYDDYIERNARTWDVLVRYIMMPGGGERFTYRDRHVTLPGIHQPVQRYHPDYSQRPLPEGQHDYRRTLYWNPNAQLDAEGRCTVTFYGNSTAKAVHVSVAGITADGHPVVLEQ